MPRHRLSSEEQLGGDGAKGEWCDAIELEIEMRDWNEREWAAWRAIEVMGRGKRQRARASVRETAKSRLKEEWESESAAEGYA